MHGLQPLRDEDNAGSSPRSPQEEEETPMMESTIIVILILVSIGALCLIGKLGKAHVLIDSLESAVDNYRSTLQYNEEMMQAMMERIAAIKDAYQLLESEHIELGKGYGATLSALRIQFRALCGKGFKNKQNSLERSSPFKKIKETLGGN